MTKPDGDLCLDEPEYVRCSQPHHDDPNQQQSDEDELIRQELNDWYDDLIDLGIDF